MPKVRRGAEPVGPTPHTGYWNGKASQSPDVIYWFHPLRRFPWWHGRQPLHMLRPVIRPNHRPPRLVQEGCLFQLSLRLRYRRYRCVRGWPVGQDHSPFPRPRCRCYHDLNQHWRRPHSSSHPSSPSPLASRIGRIGRTGRRGGGKRCSRIWLRESYI